MRSLRMRDLDFGGSGVGFVGFVAADELGLAVFAQRHLVCPPRTPQNHAIGGSARMRRLS